MDEEDRLAAALASCGFYQSSTGATDFDDRAGVVLELKSRIGGLRDLHAAMIQLARVAITLDVKQAVLVVLDHRLQRSIRSAWTEAVRLLVPAVADKLQLVALSGETVLTIPEHARLRKLGQALTSPDRRSGHSARGGAFFTVLHVLLLRWLHHQGPIQISALGQAAGISQPTIRKALKRLHGNIERDSRRRVELVSFPQREWLEMTVMAKRIRESLYFQDGSGRPRSSEQLWSRLRRRAPAGAAIGGVLAARHWDPQLDLEGTPRLDLYLHSPGPAPSVAFMTQVDPALKRTDDPHASIAVAVHRIRRDNAFFASSRSNRLGWADPVDTLLDLDELRLHDQCSDLIRRLRARHGHDQPS